jgi:hypothetical protein
MVADKDSQSGILQLDPRSAFPTIGGGGPLSAVGRSQPTRIVDSRLGASDGVRRRSARTRMTDNDKSRFKRAVAVAKNLGIHRVG